MATTVLAALPSAMLATAARLGHDTQAVAARAGLDARALTDPDGRVPFAVHARLWEELSTLGGDVGLSLGQGLGVAALGVVGHAMAHAETVGEAWTVLQRFRRLVLDDALPTLRVDGEAMRLRQPLPPRFARLRHPAECQAAASIVALRALSGQRLAARRVAFQHPAPPSVDAHRALFGTRRIEFAAAANELELEAAILARPVARADPALRDYLLHRAATLEAQLDEDDHVAVPVRRAILEGLAGGEPSLSRVARRLGTTTRTLGRRLAAEGTSFSALVEEARRERAVALLADRTRSVGAIAFALGYRDSTTFARAFRRWTGLLPTEWRERATG